MGRETISRQLTDVLKELPKEQIIKVGSRNGNAWWYVGTVEEFKKSLSSLNDQCLEHTKKSVSAGLIKRRIDARHLLTDYVPLRKRIVLDCSRSDPVADEGTVRILIEGYERGGYWVASEARKLPAVDIRGVAIGEEV